MARMVHVEKGGDWKRALDAACATLLSDGVVALPTESFYGLAVDARREEAVRRLFRIKGRGPEQPVLLLLPSLECLERYAARIPAKARLLMERFWPGGLTLVFEASQEVSPLLTAGTGTIGLRLSSHSVATGLAAALGAAVTGTSANRSGSPPCCTANEVDLSLGPGLAMILDGGTTPGGAGSTVLDVTVDPPAMLREGMVSRSSLAECLGVSPV